MLALRHLIVTLVTGVLAALALIGMFWLLYTYPVFILVGVPVCLWGLARLRS